MILLAMPERPAHHLLDIEIVVKERVKAERPVDTQGGTSSKLAPPMFDDGHRILCERVRAMVKGAGCHIDAVI